MKRFSSVSYQETLARSVSKPPEAPSLQGSVKNKTTENKTKKTLILVSPTHSENPR